MGEGGAHDFGRHPALLGGDAVGEMAHAGEGHEGDGDMGPDPVRGPVPDRPHPQVVPANPEALFHLPQPVVAGQHLRGGHVA